MTMLKPSPATNSETQGTQPLFPMYGDHIDQLAIAAENGLVVPEGPASELMVAPREKLSLRARLANILAGIVVGLEIGPGNEAIRLGTLYAAASVTSGNTLAGALAFGLSTLVVESSAALATNRLLSSDTGTAFTDRVRNEAEKRLSYSGANFSPFTKATAAFFGGSVVYTTLRKIEEPLLTPNKLRKAGLKASATLAGACALIGAMGAEAIDFANHNITVSAGAVGAVGVAAVARKAYKNTLKKKAEIGDIWKDVDPHGNQYRYIANTPENADVLERLSIEEQAIWDERGYGNLEEEGYGPHIAASRTSAAFTEEGTFVAVNRMFGGDEEMTPPALEMPMDDEGRRETLKDLARKGLLEELGTVAVAKEWRGKGVNTQIWRMAYRDAVARGIKHWVIIMEPDRVENMNKRYGFTFEKIGEAKEYQGGDCALHIMDLEQANNTMALKHPLAWFWFTKAPLKKY